MGHGRMMTSHEPPVVLWPLSRRSLSIAGCQATHKRAELARFPSANFDERATTPETRNLINQFLQYPENSAGSIMTAEYIGLKRNMTVEQAFAYIRENGVDKETIYTCFVTDSKRPPIVLSGR